MNQDFSISAKPRAARRIAHLANLIQANVDPHIYELAKLDKIDPEQIAPFNLSNTGQDLVQYLVDCQLRNLVLSPDASSAALPIMAAVALEKATPVLILAHSTMINQWVSAAHRVGIKCATLQADSEELPAPVMICRGHEMSIYPSAIKALRGGSLIIDHLTEIPDRYDADDSYEGLYFEFTRAIVAVNLALSHPAGSPALQKLRNSELHFDHSRYYDFIDRLFPNRGLSYLFNPSDTVQRFLLSRGFKTTKMMDLVSLINVATHLVSNTTY